MAKDILFGESAHAKLLAGAEKVYKVVCSTLGGKGRNVIIERPYGSPQIIGDGVTIAKEIKLEDRFENLAADLLIESSDKTNNDVGDGTTATVLLAYEILKRGLREIGNGENPQMFKDELKEASEKVIEELSKMCKPVKTKAAMVQVAKISSANEEVGNLVGSAYEKISADGTLTVDLSPTNETYLEYKDGLTVPAGYILPHFITDPNSLKAELENPYILITDKDISGVDEFLELLKTINQDNKSVLIIASNVTGSALGTLIVNKNQGFLKPIVVKAYGGGDLKEGMLSDIALATGGVFISDKEGIDIRTVTKDQLGRADKVISDRNETIILGAKGDTAKVEDRVTQLKKFKEKAVSQFEEEKFQERLSRLSGGIAVIYAGGNSESEQREKRLRIEDAIHATRAAIEEGIVPGGGIALYHAREVLATRKTVGDRILYDILEEPFKKILTNAGVEPYQIIPKFPDRFTVFNVVTNQLENAFETGIVDPLKVVRTCLENAVSIASLLLTTGTAVTIIPEEKKEPL